MAKVESRSEKPEFFAKGGDGSMFEKGTAHKSLPGQSGKESNGGDSQQWAAGGKSGQMFGKGHAGKKVPGVSGKQTQEG